MDLYINESLTETNDIVFDCENCGYTSWEDFEECPRCGKEIEEW